MTIRRVKLLAGLALAVTFGACLPASAQFSPRQRNVAGEFDYYAMVMSWSPSHCAEAQRGRDDLQCERRDGRRYSFVLHGLWPQYERGYPEACPLRGGRNYVPRPVVDDMLDIMPAPGLVIHEYKKHGTCSGLDPQNYYRLARSLYRKIQIPQEFTNPMEPRTVSPDEVMRAFVDANPGLKPDMLAISCGGSGNRLQEIRFCFSKEGQPRACGQNENQRRMCSAQKMYLPPVRSTKAGPDTPSDRARATPPQRPRVIH
jgi:ribonuclease T2